MSFFDAFKVDKLNPVQPGIQAEEGYNIPTTQVNEHTIASAYEAIEVVNRCCNLIIDMSSLLSVDIGERISGVNPVKRVTAPKVSNLLRRSPNPFMDISMFKRQLVSDMVFEGNMFIYYDGISLYPIPACRVEIITDDKEWVQGYRYTFMPTQGQNRYRTIHFTPDEIIHIKDNSARSVYRGDSRVNCTLESLNLRYAMTQFRKNFFKSGAAIGLVLETDSILSKKLKSRTELDWTQKFNPTKQNGRPLILDAGMKAKSVADSNFNAMDYQGSIDKIEGKVAAGLGVPMILLESGNNANIRPNVELFFNLTIYPLMRKLISGIERYFGYDLDFDVTNVPALQPDLDAQTKRLTSLTNNGIIVGNEARQELRLEPIDDPVMNTIRIPANVAGSATGVDGEEGGAPENTESDDSSETDKAIKSFELLAGTIKRSN